MNTLRLTTIALLLFPFSTLLQAQITEWMPIPYGQTSIFQDQNGEIIPMETDWFYPGGAGDFYGTYYQFLEDEFDTCAVAIWSPDSMTGLGRPRCDFRMYRYMFTLISVWGAQDEFYIPLDAEPGDWSYFGLDFVMHFDQQVAQTILGTADSVREFSIYAADSSTLVGSLALSKGHGLVEYTPIQVFEEYPIGAGTVWTLIGMTDTGSQAGVQMPAKADYVPYSVGDQLLFKHTHHESGPSQNTEVIQYHQVTLTATGMGSGGEGQIIGICQKYDEQGFYIETDSSYAIDIDPMLSGIVDRGASVPYYYLGHATSGMPVFSDWYETQDSGIVCSTGGYESGYCSGAIVDGYAQYETYSTEHGLLWKKNGGFGPPEIWELVAAQGQDLDYGDWPQWLGTEHVTNTSEVKLYPMPASDRLFIQTESSSPLQVELWSPLGQRVLSQRLQNNESLNVSGLSQGAYILKYASDRVSGSQPVLIQR